MDRAPLRCQAKVSTIGRAHALTVRPEGDVRAAVGPPAPRVAPTSSRCTPSCRAVLAAAAAAGERSRRCASPSGRRARDDRDLPAVAGHGRRPDLWRRRPRMPAPAPCRQSRAASTTCSAISTRTRVIARMVLQHALAHRQPELLDLAGAEFARGACTRFLSASPGGRPSACRRESGREVSFEPERHGQLLGIVTIAAAHDAQHAKPGFAVAARFNPMHAPNCTDEPL